MLLSAGESSDSIAKVVCMWHFAQRGSRAASERSIGDGCYVAGDERSREVAVGVWPSGRLQCMVRLLGSMVRLSLCSNASVPFGLGDDPWQRKLRHTCESSSLVACRSAAGSEASASAPGNWFGAARMRLRVGPLRTARSRLHASQRTQVMTLTTMPSLSCPPGRAYASVMQPLVRSVVVKRDATLDDSERGPR
jgi:hypothetical protein